MILVCAATGAPAPAVQATADPAQVSSPRQPEPSALEILKASIEEMKLQDSLLAGLCYDKTVIVNFLDGDLETKKSEERLITVTSIPHGPDLEILMAVDGKPTSSKERQKSLLEQKERGKSGSPRLDLSSDDLISQFEWTLAGSEEVNGRPSTILSFKPKPGAVYKGSDARAGKFIKKVRGRIWVDDQERVISRMEFKSTAPIKAFGGFLWTLNSLSVTEERRRLPQGVWIDSTGEYFIDAKALVVKRIVRRQTMRTHDYRRCSATALDSLSTQPIRARLQ